MWVEIGWMRWEVNPWNVTPFGECGLKSILASLGRISSPGHSLWGVWVEIFPGDETHVKEKGHSLWGVWVEIPAGKLTFRTLPVTPFGECGLK